VTATLAVTPHRPAGLHASRRRPAAVVGLAFLVLALAVVLFPDKASPLIGAACGWALWLAGALMLGFAILMFTGPLRLAGVVASLAAAGLGAWLTFHPTVGALAAALLLAAAFVIDGAFQLAAALHLRPLRVWRWMLASALTSLAAAALVAAGLPDRTVEAVSVLLGAALATTGAALLVLGFTRRGGISRPD
jgi:uncharacterized membrane protein HdeD (DUF308 family)